MATALSFFSISPSPLTPSRRGTYLRRFKTGTPPGQSRLTTASFRNNGSTRPETDCPVPQEQQPVNEYHNLSSSSWAASAAASDPIELGSRLFATGLSFSLLVGLPVSWFGSSDPEPIRLLLGSVSSGIFVTTVAVVRMYLGWAYVGNRLLSATVEYEETGWYDGQIWVKTPEVLTRNRLLGSFQAKPILNRLKNILIVLAASLLTCGLLMVDFETSQSAYRDTDRGGRDRAVAGVYSEESARSFEPDAFCGEPSPDSE